jgi:hypothetical protein
MNADAHDMSNFINRMDKLSVGKNGVEYDD